MLIGKINSGNLGFKGIYDPNVLITGSSGYIGSHLVPKLADDGVNCIVCCRDKYKQEYLDTIIAEINRYKTDKSLCSFANFDLTNEAEINKLLKENKPVDAVIHLGGSTYNSESIVNPRKYYDNNVIASRNLVNSMLDNDVKNILYVSTASIYPKTIQGRVSEKRTPVPKTPYAKTKFITEQLINDYKVYGLKSTILRLFNVAGAHGFNDLDIGKNVITVLLNLIKDNRLFTLMGNDYPTPDGTCVKDFIHVDDVTEAIGKSAAKLLEPDTASQTYNLGTGKGTSLGELIRKSIDITGKELKLRIGAALEDEVPSLIANNTKIKKDLGWAPQKNIEEIITSCWKWILQNGGKR